MSPESRPGGPLCPSCGRQIAAWRMEHCVYCGAAFPDGLKEGFSEPEALKWVERPSLPSDAARQLELLKVLPMERKRPAAAYLGLLVLPVFGILFYLLYQMVLKASPASGFLVLIAGAGFFAYLVWALLKRS
ncbi:MAG: hypothetical protein ABJC61_05310 [Acidobacteriota bacterium]